MLCIAGGGMFHGSNTWFSAALLLISSRPSCWKHTSGMSG